MAEIHNINDKKHTTEPMPEWSLEWHDPRTLLTDKNIREIEPDADMIQSVANVGVLQPIIAVRTTEGQVRVRYGEGRTLAAIAAELDSVPVIVTGLEGDAKTDEIARIVRQRAENKYRQGMTVQEDTNSAYQMSLYGASDKEIADQLLMPQKQVRAARKIGSSKKGAELINDHGLDLIDAAKIAEFDDNPERYERLLRAARNPWSGTIDSLIRDWKAEDKAAAAVAKVRKSLEAQGVRVTDRRVGSGRNDAVRYVLDLVDDNGAPLTVEGHVSCPGHAMVVEDVEYFVAADGTLTTDLTQLPEEEQADTLQLIERLEGIAVCDQANELHPGPPRPEATPEERAAEDARERSEAEQKEAQRAERRRVIAGNKEWDAAVPVRRAWVQNLVQRKTPPKGAMEFLTGELLLAQHAVIDGFRDGHSLAADWLGVEPGNETQFAWQAMPAPRRTALQKLGVEANDKRRTVLLLAVVLAANEQALNRHSWRQNDPNKGCAQRDYLRFLIDQGYPACSVERLAAGRPIEEVTDEDQDHAAETGDAETADETEQPNDADDHDDEMVTP